ncbi:MAG: ABC transporter ATP-binding protein [Limisphaerales bacterium]
MSQPIISARNISKRYRLGATHAHDTLRDRITHSLRRLVSSGSEKSNGDEILWALSDISFDVDQGDVVGVVGRNGAGKSTLLKILSRITEPTSGEIRVRGRLASLLEVGTGFHPELTGRENIFLNGAILGMKQAEVRKKFDAIVAFSEVEKFLDTPIKRYSSGMYVRLAFAVAAHLEPEILVVDEVLAVGDAQFQSKCLGKMGEVAREGRTVLFVSHNMAAVSALCRKGLLLQGGRLTKTGPIEEIVSAYVATTGQGAHQFTATNRSGSGTVRITNVEVSSSRGQNVVVCGAKMTFTISYEAQKPDLPIQFVVGIFDAFNVRILFLDSQVDPSLPQNFPTRGKIRLEFGEEFSLNPGRYSVNIGARVHSELTDYLKGAIVFDVQEGNFFGSGRMAADKGSVLYRNNWQFEADKS